MKAITSDSGDSLYLHDFDQQVLEYPQLLDATTMQSVDQCAIEQGVDSFWLMRNAALGVFKHAMDVVSLTGISAQKIQILVLVGPGNNGADGLVVAALLRDCGCQVTVLCTNPLPEDQSDAAKAAAMWNGPTLLQNNDQRYEMIRSSDIVIDALFGAGLSRALDASLAALVQCVNNSDARVIAIDVPSGLDGNTHQVVGTCIEAHSTVTFFRFKPAHVLYPGRALCGTKHLVQIGLEEEHITGLEAECRFNAPLVFKDALPIPENTGHKFDRGHVLVRSGPVNATGAARLSANTASYSGAGLVTLATTSDALVVNASHLTAVMLTICDTALDWESLLEDKRINTLLIGPGNETDDETRAAVKHALSCGKPCVLDAGALSCWAGRAHEILPYLAAAKAATVLTPHSAEFQRLFGQSDVSTKVSRLHQAIQGARLSNCTLILKGADTVIAAADGRACINANAPPWLATAGAGDVLAGLVASLMAQGMQAFDASCAAVWLHGSAAAKIGYPLSAEQLVQVVGQELGLLVNQSV